MKVCKTAPQKLQDKDVKKKDGTILNNSHRMKTAVRTMAKMKAARKRHHMLLKCLAMRLQSHETSKIMRSQGCQSANRPLEKEKMMTYLTAVFVE